jgi:hypothetical protein
MFCAPALPAGVLHVIDVADTTVTFVHETPPTVTVAPARKFVPVIVIDVPPALVPEEAETLDTVGTAASGVTLTALEAEDRPAELRAFKYTVYVVPPVRPGIVTGDVASSGFSGIKVIPSNEYS